MLDKLNATVINCNILYSGTADNLLAKTIPFDIMTFGKTKVGFVGVTTPYTLSTTSNITFVEDDSIVYDFCQGVNGTNLYSVVQSAVKEVTGSQIADALEWSYQFVSAQSASDGNPVGEYGGFFHLSGIRCTIDTSIASPVEYDASHTMTGIADKSRRVSNIEVLDSEGSYIPIDMDAKYTVTGTEFVIDNCGDGNTAFNGGQSIDSDKPIDSDVLLYYIKDVLQGSIAAKYSDIEGRIVIK